VRDRERPAGLQVTADPVNVAHAVLVSG
jgi:hypothetical protein